MPYLPKDAALKSDYYNKIINSNQIEYDNYVQSELDKMSISGSTSLQPPRNEDGVLLSFENGPGGEELNEKLQEVRIPNAQYFFNGNLDYEFDYFIQDNSIKQDVDDELVQIKEEQSIKVAPEAVVQVQLSNREYLVRFLAETGDLSGKNLDLAENEDTKKTSAKILSTSALNGGVIRFFKRESIVGGNNAEGWEEFRKNENRNVRKFAISPFTGLTTPTNTLSGIGTTSFSNLRSAMTRLAASVKGQGIFKDLNAFRYDNIIENWIYSTRKGQQVWMSLGFPYIEDVD